MADDVAERTDLRWAEAGLLSDLWEDDMQGIEIDGEDILLIHRPAGVVHAYQGICPHQEQKLSEGFLDEGLLVCTSHMWEFDAHTGAGINPDTCSLYRYPVRIEDGSILVGIPQDGLRHYNRGS
jgi:toluene monooxygenase system ferredoxin subunit